MKRNVNLIVLTLEIAAIVILHAVKMNQEPAHRDFSNIHQQQKNNPAASVRFLLVNIK